MKKKTVSSIGFLLLALPVTPAAQAYDIKDASGYYNYSGPTKRSVFVTYMDLQDNVDAYSGDVIIPASITADGKEVPVKGVGDHAMFNCQFVSSLTLPEGVGYILDQAFSHCYYMTSVKLPESMELIRDYAFEYCEDLTEISIPAKVSEFGYGVFTNCTGLVNIKVDEANTLLEDRDGILYTKGGRALVQYPAGRTADEFTVPAGTTQISDYAFTPAPFLRRIGIGPDVESISVLTFADCAALEEINVDEGNSALISDGGVLYNAGHTALIQYPRSRSGESYTVPEPTAEILDMSLASCSDLKALTLPATTARLGEYALHGTMLKDITLLAVTPPAVSAYTFDNSRYSSTTLHVPAESLQAYRSHGVWGLFSNIIAIGDSDVHEIEDATDVIKIESLCVSAPGTGMIRIYDLCGALVTEGTGSVQLPAPGIYIAEYDGKATKITAGI